MATEQLPIRVTTPLILALVLLGSTLSFTITSASVLNFAALPAGGSDASLVSVFYGVKLQASLKTLPDSKSKTCDWLASSDAATSAEEAYQKLFIGTTFSCNSDKLKVIAKEAEPLLKTASPAFAALSAQLIKANKLPASVPDVSSLAATIIASLDDKTSLSAVGVALEALAALNAIGQLPAGELSKLKAFFRKVTSAATTTQDSHGNSIASFYSTSHEASSLSVTSSIVAGALAFKDGLGLSKSLLLQLARFIIEGGQPVTLAEASNWAAAAAALNDNSLAIPVFVSAPASLSLTASDSQLKVQLVTALGNPVAGASVTVTVRDAKGKTVVAEKALQGSTPSFHASLFTKQSALGSYKLEIKPSTEDSKYVSSSVTLGLLVSADIEVTDVAVAVLDSEVGKPEAETILDFSSKSQISSLPANHLQKLRVALKLKDPAGKAFVPQQAVLTLTHIDSGLSHSFLLKSSAGKLAAKVELLEMTEKLLYLSGEYSLLLQVGDARMENSFSWDLGTVDLDLPAAPEGTPPPPSRAVPPALRFAALPQIAHIFRKPEKRPPTSFSSAFTILALAPLLLLVGGFVALGVNLKGLPTSGLPFLSAVGFHAGLAALLLVYVNFWLQMNLFTTLKLIGLFALLTAVPGHRILSYLADSSAPKVKTA